MERFEVIEFWGKGDPFFGGTADDRPLGKTGSFLTGGYAFSAVATFDTREAAQAAADAAPNRRAGGRISVIPAMPCTLEVR